jgi:hypothetical protein
MPVTSGRQFRAMAAAAAGRSTLGIPQSVGAEMIHKTPAHKRKKFAKKRGKPSKNLEMLREMAKKG